MIATSDGKKPRNERAEMTVLLEKSSFGLSVLPLLATVQIPGPIQPIFNHICGLYKRIRLRPLSNGLAALPDSRVRQQFMQ